MRYTQNSFDTALSALSVAANACKSETIWNHLASCTLQPICSHKLLKSPNSSHLYASFFIQVKQP